VAANHWLWDCPGARALFVIGNFSFLAHFGLNEAIAEAKLYRPH